MPLSIFSLSRTRRLSSRDGLLLKFMSLTSSSSSMSSSSMSLQGATLHVFFNQAQTQQRTTFRREDLMSCYPHASCARCSVQQALQ